MVPVAVSGENGSGVAEDCAQVGDGDREPGAQGLGKRRAHHRSPAADQERIVEQVTERVEGAAHRRLARAHAAGGTADVRLFEQPVQCEDSV